MSAMRIVNARKLAANQATLQGSLPIEALTDTHDRLVNSTGELDYTLVFDALRNQSDSFPVVVIKLQAEVCLACQRSLKPYQQLVSAESQVALVVGAEQAKGIGEEYEPFACLDSELDIFALLTEELLLALPLVAIDSNAPVKQVVTNEIDKQIETEQLEKHPFAGLADLKQKLTAKQD